MGDKTGIEWTDATWNPIIGCSIVSPGCTNCYAMKQAARIERMGGKGGAKYAGLTHLSKGGPIWTGTVRLNEDALLQPLRWKRPRRIFVNSMSDLFHEAVPDEWIDRIFAVMALAPQHTFQVLTTRAERMRLYMSDPAVKRRIYELASDMTLSLDLEVILIAPGADERQAPTGPRIYLDRWTLPNVWLGVSAEDQARADERIPELLRTPAAVRFVSAEPLLGPLDLTNLDHLGTLRNDGIHGISALWVNNGLGRAWLDWVIVGGESGPRARPMHPDWPRDIRDQCAAAGAAFHFKQHGEWIGVPDLRGLPGGGGPGFGAYDHCRYDQEHEAVLVGKRRAGRLLDGRTHDGMPQEPIDAR